MSVVVATDLVVKKFSARINTYKILDYVVTPYSYDALLTSPILDRSAGLRWPLPPVVVTIPLR